MSADRPLISLGMPVYNGAKYVREAIRSALAQSHEDFELVVSDNHSTDGTDAILREVASRDARVRLFRQDENLGAAPNYNFVFEKSRGRYFKWFSHDDRIDANYLEVCLARLEADPGAILCHGTLTDTDADGNVIETFTREGTLSEDPVTRFRSAIAYDHNCQEIFGLIRRDALATTKLIRSYQDCDRTLLAELALRGRFAWAKETRLLRRQHDGKSTRAHVDRASMAQWYDTRKGSRLILPASAQMRDEAFAIVRSDLPWGVKMRCFHSLARHLWWAREVYRAEYAWFARHLLRADG